MSEASYPVAGVDVGKDTMGASGPGLSFLLPGLRRSALAPDPSLQRGHCPLFFAEVFLP